METNQGISNHNGVSSHLGKLFAAALFLILFQGTPARGTVLLDDTFTDNERSTQNLPTSAAWYSSGNASTLSASTGALVLSTGTTSRQALAYFTNSGAQTLNIGDSLSVSFTLAETTFSSTSVFRVGLFNSGTARVSADSTGNTNAAFTNYTGYSLFTSLTSNQPTGTTLRERSVADTSLFGTVANVVLTGTAPTLNLTDSTVYNFTLTLTYSSSTAMTINALVKDGTNTTTLMNFTSTDTTSPFTSFDTFAFYGAGGSSTTTSALTLDNVLVTYTSVPEPGSCGLAALGVGAVLWRLRRVRTL